jgi:hypothetical protein
MALSNSHDFRMLKTEVRVNIARQGHAEMLLTKQLNFPTEFDRRIYSKNVHYLARIML